MTKTETIRIAAMNEDERTIVNALSPEERKEMLVKGGQAKIQLAIENIREQKRGTPEQKAQGEERAR